MMKDLDFGISGFRHLPTDERLFKHARNRMRERLGGIELSRPEFEAMNRHVRRQPMTQAGHGRFRVKVFIRDVEVCAIFDPAEDSIVTFLPPESGNRTETAIEAAFRLADRKKNR